MAEEDEADPVPLGSESGVRGWSPCPGCHPCSLVTSGHCGPARPQVFISITGKLSSFLRPNKVSVRLQGTSGGLPREQEHPILGGGGEQRDSPSQS